MQYVLEANAKVNEKGHNLQSNPPKTPQPIWAAIQKYHYVCPGSVYAKFGGNRFGRYESAHA